MTPIGRLRGADFEDVFGVERIEVEPVDRVVVGGDGFGVAVHHDRFIAFGAQPGHRLDAAGVEFDALADSHRAAAENDDRPSRRRLLVAVTEAAVEIGGARLEFGGAGVDPPTNPKHPGLESAVFDLRSCLAKESPDVGVGKAEPLDGGQHPGFIDAGGNLGLRRHQPVYSAEEPGVDAGHRLNALDTPTAAQGFGELPKTVRGGLGKPPFEIRVVGRRNRRRRFQRIAIDFERPDRFEKGFLERAPHGRDFSHSLHRGAEAGVRSRELLEGEARNFDHHVIESGLERRRRGSGDVVGDLVEPAPERDLGCDAGDRETGRFGSQRRRSRNPWIHFDDHVTAVFRIDGELDVGAAGGDSDRVEHDSSRVPQDLVLAVGQGLGRGHRDRVAGVDSHRIEVFDRTHDDERAGRVAHHLELVLLPAENRGLDQHLVGRRGLQPLLEEDLEALAIVSDAAAPPAEGEGRAENRRQPDEIECRDARLDGSDGRRRQDRQTGFLHREPKFLAVLGEAYRAGRRSEQPDTEPLQDTGLFELDGQVESGLPAEGRDQCVGPFLFEDGGYGLGGQRFHIAAVREPRVGHHGRWVRVDQNDPAALLAKRPYALHPRIVELAGLADADRARAQDAHGGRFGVHPVHRPENSEFGIRISDFSPTRPLSIMGGGRKFRNPKFRIPKS